MMLLKSMTSMALVGGWLTTIAAFPGPTAQAASRYQHSASAASSSSSQQNIRESERYDRLVATDPAFRRLRIRVECGPVTDPVLHQQCIESFHREVHAWRDGRLQAFYGSSMAPNNYTSSSGR
jgi:hypothetical protein